jgi:hypothetical protein
MRPLPLDPGRAPPETGSALALLRIEVPADQFDDN